MSTKGFQGLEKSAAPAVSFSEKSTAAEHLVLMCASALFAGLTERDCREIVSCSRARTFARDEILFLQGQPVRNLILLETGSVKLTQLSSTGNEVLMWMSGTGEPVNVHAGLMTCNHTCSARAMERCRALVWEYSRLQTLLSQFPLMRNNISRILNDRLQELEERFREVATEKVARRLALTLLRLVKHVGKPSEGGTEISLTREELAQMTGTTLFTISRILSKWAEKGFIRPRRESVVVNDQAMLESASEDED